MERKGRKERQGSDRHRPQLGRSGRAWKKSCCVRFLRLGQRRAKCDQRRRSSFNGQHTSGFPCTFESSLTRSPQGGKEEDPPRQASRRQARPLGPSPVSPSGRHGAGPPALWSQRQVRKVVGDNAGHRPLCVNPAVILGLTVAGNPNPNPIPMTDSSWEQKWNRSAGRGVVDPLNYWESSPPGSRHCRSALSDPYQHRQEERPL